MKKLIQFLLLLFIVFSVVPFLPVAITNIIQGELAHVKFTNNSPWMGINIRYVKDVLMILLLVLISIDDLFRKRENVKSNIFLFYFSVLLLAVYGYSVLYFQTQSTNFLIAVAGIRSMLLFVFCFRAVQYFITDSFKKTFSIILGILITIEFIVMILEYYVFTKHYGIVNPFSLRLIGTFGGIALAGYLALGASTFLFINHKDTKYTKCLLLMCFIISVLSGTRAAIFGCLLIMAASIVRMITKGDKISKKNLFNLIIGIFGLVVAYPLVTLLGSVSERGSILDAQLEGGRIDLFLNFFRNSPIQVIFGKGIGYGTNASVGLNREHDTGLDTQILDGTINALISQYGIIVFFVILTLFYIFALKLIKNNTGRIEEVVVLLFVTLLMSITVNIFEQFSFLFLLFISYFSFQQNWTTKGDNQLNTVLLTGQTTKKQHPAFSS